MNCMPLVDDKNAKNCHVLNKTSVLSELRKYNAHKHSPQLPPIILTAPEKGSTLSWFQRHQPAGGCYDVLPFEKQEKG